MSRRSKRCYELPSTLRQARCSDFISIRRRCRSSTTSSTAPRRSGWSMRPVISTARAHPDYRALATAYRAYCQPTSDEEAEDDNARAQQALVDTPCEPATEDSSEQSAWRCDGHLEPVHRCEQGKGQERHGGDDHGDDALEGIRLTQRRGQCQSDDGEQDHTQSAAEVAAVDAADGNSYEQCTRPLSMSAVVIPQAAGDRWLGRDEQASQNDQRRYDEVERTLGGEQQECAAGRCRHSRGRSQGPRSIRLIVHQGAQTEERSDISRPQRDRIGDVCGDATYPSGHERREQHERPTARYRVDEATYETRRAEQADIGDGHSAEARACTAVRARRAAARGSAGRALAATPSTARVGFSVRRTSRPGDRVETVLTVLAEESPGSTGQGGCQRQPGVNRVRRPPRTDRRFLREPVRVKR